MPTCGFNFDTLPTCDSHRYCVVTHLSTFRYSTTENVKKKKKPQRDQNTPHMKNIHKHKEHTPRKLIQIKLSNINHRSIKIYPEFSQGVVDTD